MLSDFFTYSHLAGLLSVAAGLIFFGWIVFRTRSWYIFKFFLWRMFHGKSGILDPVIKGYLGEQSSLMLFRFVAVDVETNRDAQETIQWAKEKNVSLETVGRAGEYFDPKNRCINEKKVRWIIFDRRAFAVVSIFFMVLIIAVFLSLVTSRAILVFKESGRWFLLGPSSAKTLFVRGSEEFERSECSKLENIDKFGFSRNDAADVCKFWQDAKINAYIDKTVHHQRVAGGWLLFIFSLFSFRSWRGAGKAKAAQKVKERLDAHEASV